MLHIKDITKNYGEFCVLKDINIEFENGIYGILAPNGSGKTTLIKIITTLIFPSEGEILFKGKNILDIGEDYRSLLGYLPQRFGYYKNYSPETFLMYIAALKGIRKEDAEKRIKELLDMVALSDVTNKKMKKFSGGMIQRVGIAQALLNDPKILILDEPTAGLDPKERVRFRNLLSELSRDRIIIISTHIVSDIEAIANQVIMIKDRVIIHKDTIDKICNVLDKKVFEIDIENEDIVEFRKNYLILGQRQQKNKIRVRFISDIKESDKWEEVYPNLEDVFLYEYQDKI
ncbi:ABC transporter ATP-binding protein [Paeniclostridium sordellii]|uniref:ABC transporter ATP-binding protein n=2 Tax=Paraclostridium sordellii TaxID=1505 RepID=UPI00210EA0D0|nr:ABC transporter ATP-binding protein [Paeniclostridium sordellii]MCQ4699157.1 ABC transporter ATP-binding protein [Paeniclostridium sordellii]MDU6482816.1 ABC transporter ATP-binding protein [Paeniclostridium sordellii]